LTKRNYGTNAIDEPERRSSPLRALTSVIVIIMLNGILNVD